MNWLIREKMLTYFYNKFRPVNCMHYIKYGVNTPCPKKIVPFFNFFF